MHDPWERLKSAAASDVTVTEAICWTPELPVRQDGLQGNEHVEQRSKTAQCYCFMGLLHGLRDNLVN